MFAFPEISGGQKYCHGSTCPVAMSPCRLGTGKGQGRRLGCVRRRAGPGPRADRPAGRKRVKGGKRGAANSGEVFLPSYKKASQCFSSCVSGWKPARVTMAMRNYYRLPRLGEKACTFGFPTGGVDLCNSEWQEAGRTPRPTPRWRPPAARAALGRPWWARLAPSWGGLGGALGGGLAADRPREASPSGEGGGAKWPPVPGVGPAGRTVGRWTRCVFWKPAEQSVCGPR